MISTGKISAATIIFLPIIFFATFAETFVSGRIEDDRVWSAEEDPYVASGKIIVESGAELTIEPGVESACKAARRSRSGAFCARSERCPNR